MGDYADMLKGKRIIKADDSGGKLELTTDQGDYVMVPIDPERCGFVTSKFPIDIKPLTDATQ